MALLCYGLLPNSMTMPKAHRASGLKVLRCFRNPSRFEDISGLLGSGAGREEGLLVRVGCVMSCWLMGGAVAFFSIRNANPSSYSVGDIQLFQDLRAQI